MENRKAKGLIIVLLIMLLLVYLGVIIWQYVEIKNTDNVLDSGATTNKVDNMQQEQQNVENKQPENEKNEQATNKTENKFDPYAKYKNLNWSNTFATSTTAASIRISDSKVFVTYEEVTTEVKGIEGTPVKVAYKPGAMLWFEVLTKEGKVYVISDWETSAELYISKYNIIDMTTWSDEEPALPIYYLTAEGKLINNEGEDALKVDPYANYKNIDWSFKGAESKTGASIMITLEDKVIVNYDNKTRQVTGIEGKPIKVINTIGGGIPFFYILTVEGRVYNIEEWDTEAVLIADLSKYEVIDMTPHINGNNTYSPMCYLTAEGKLIDSKGNSYK